MNDGADVLARTQDGILVVTLNRPDKRNAMTRAMSERIAHLIDEFETDPGLRVLVFTGAGPAFCAGMDLARFAAGETPSLPGRGFGGITQRPPSKPTIAAVEGFALAGGFEFVLACDLVVAAADAVFGLPEVQRGLVARAGGLLRLPERLPRTIALELVLTGERLPAERAAQWGLVNQVVAAGEAEEAALALARRIAGNAPLAVATSKQIIDQAATWPEGERYERQLALAAPVFASADAHEGAVAFAEKRPAVWSGR